MGRYYTQPPEMRAKISAGVKRSLTENPELNEAKRARQTGRPSRGGHVTNHERRNNPKPETCGFCREAVANDEPWTRGGGQRG